MSSRWVPLWGAAVGLAGALTALVGLYGSASRALDGELRERLRGAGASAAIWLSESPISDERLQRLMAAHGLEAAYVIDRQRRLFDAGGDEGAPIDWLRVDPSAVERAFAGEASIDASYDLGGLKVATGFFPLARDGKVGSVLVLEAGEAFARRARDPWKSLLAGIGLLCLTAVALGIVAARWVRAERARQAAAAQNERTESLARMAAMAAHEIRNPLGIIRGNVELMRGRLHLTLTDRDRRSLEDILAEVERLKRLTGDFMELTAEKPLEEAEVDLAALIDDVARSVEASYPGIRVLRSGPPRVLIRADAARLRQVFWNLASNAAESQGQGDVDISLETGAAVRVRVTDRGPGVSPELRGRLFEPFVTTRSKGTGLGLAISRRIVQRHSGTLRLLDTAGGATFEVTLPGAA